MFLVDNNLSPKIARHLLEYFPGTKHVADVGLEKAVNKSRLACPRLNYAQGFQNYLTGSPYFHFFNRQWRRDAQAPVVE